MCFLAKSWASTLIPNEIESGAEVPSKSSWSTRRRLTWEARTNVECWSDSQEREGYYNVRYCTVEANDECIVKFYYTFCTVSHSISRQFWLKDLK